MDDGGNAGRVNDGNKWGPRAGGRHAPALIYKSPHVTIAEGVGSIRLPRAPHRRPTPPFPLEVGCVWRPRRTEKQATPKRARGWGGL